MKYFFLFFSLCLIRIQALAQKKLIDSSVFDRWPSLQYPAINCDGKYVVYTIDKMPLGNHTLVIQATDNKWRKEIVGGSEPRFTQDGKKLVYKVNVDSLYLWQLGTESFEFYPYVQSYQLVILQKREWLAMQVTNGVKELRLHDLTGYAKKLFTHVEGFTLSKNGKSLLLQTHEQFEGRTKNMVKWVNIEKGDSRVIWESGISSDTVSHAESLVFDNNGDQAVFIVSEPKSGKSEISIWYYRVGMEQAVEKMNSQSADILSECIIASGKFNREGSCILFEVMKWESGAKQRSGVLVDIWSYTDDKLQPQQLREAGEPLSYTGLINLDNNQVVLLKGENEVLYENIAGLGNYALITTAPCFSEENNWRSTCRVPLYLVNTHNGTRQLVKDGLVYSDVNGVSPDGKYVLYYDRELQAYFSYNIINGRTVNISQNIPFPVCDKVHARAGLPHPYNLINNWLPSNKGLIIYDEFDLWQLDPAGITPPLCLSKGYGRANGIVLRLAEENGIITEQRVILNAFRESDKANGFYQLNLTKPGYPELLTLGPYIYYCTGIGGVTPAKAANADTWLVQRMSASEAPNYFITKNFKSFRQLSDLQPQKGYNWLTSELYEWSMFDGRKSQGILYKPENFDSLKKYPIIFHFYEEKSDELHKYLIPEAIGSYINIPLFVSNGYLVFVPDIHYTTGETIESIYNSVGSAARNLSQYSWVDSTRMGLQGHSLGGYEVHALITRTGMFAAAASAAGASNLISNTGSIDGRGGYSLAYLSEIMSYRIGGTIWEKRDEYIRNSPVLYADRVKTPLLMFNCKADGVVPFGQGVEFFIALRRMGKPVWMLQYDNGAHQLGGLEAKDYTIRLTQFFDHYLKKRPAPKWMILGVPAKLKGIETGYEFND